MKKLLCVVLTLIMIAATAAIAVPASAEVAETGAGVLTVTVNGQNPVQVEVGNVFIVRVGLYAGSSKIVNGQVHMEYDPKYVSFVQEKAYNVDSEGDDVEGYCFPASLCRASLVMNYSDPGLINYNFTKIKGTEVFDSTDKRFARFRFKATAAGTTDIIHALEYMINLNEVRVFYDSKPDKTINPSVKVTVEPATACIGDADNDNEVTLLDATYMQRIAAGANIAFDKDKTDVSGDKIVSLKDSVIVRKYLAGMSVNSAVGKYQFASGDPD